MALFEENLGYIRFSATSADKMVILILAHYMYRMIWAL